MGREGKGRGGEEGQNRGIENETSIRLLYFI